MRRKERVLVAAIAVVLLAGVAWAIYRGIQGDWTMASVAAVTFVIGSLAWMRGGR